MAHKNVKKFKRRRNAIVAGTIVIVAGTVALVVEDPSDPFGMEEEELELFMTIVSVVIVSEETILITVF